jgi:hypothetical protein
VRALRNHRFAGRTLFLAPHTLQEGGLDREEVAGKRACGLLTQERPPGRACSLRRRRYTRADQYLAHRGRRDGDANPFLAHRRCEGIPSWDSHTRGEGSACAGWARAAAAPAFVRIRPAAGDQLPMPTQQRLRLHREARPRRSRERATKRRQERAVGRGEPRTVCRRRIANSTTEKLNLHAPGPSLRTLRPVASSLTG